MTVRTNEAFWRVAQAFLTYELLMVVSCVLIIWLTGRLVRMQNKLADDALEFIRNA